jgi:uncharacterized membrane protein YphA (DoxX/SURF4 family)
MSPLFPLFGLTGVLEFFGGILILLRLFTRPAAFVLAGEMAVAYLMAHAPAGSFPVNNGGDAAILYCVVFLYLMVAEGGLELQCRAAKRGRSGAVRLRTRRPEPLQDATECLS